MNPALKKHFLFVGATSLMVTAYMGISQADTSIASSSNPSLLQLTSSNQNGAMKISDVRTLYVMPFQPDSGGFRSNFIDGLKASNRFKIVSSKAQADAFVTGAAHSTGYGFRGEISVISNQDNRVLWSGTATRRDGTGDRMAFNQLVARLTAAASEF